MAAADTPWSWHDFHDMENRSFSDSEASETTDCSSPSGVTRMRGRFSPANLSSVSSCRDLDCEIFEALSAVHLDAEKTHQDQPQSQADAHMVLKLHGQLALAKQQLACEQRLNDELHKLHSNTLHVLAQTEHAWFNERHSSPRTAGPEPCTPATPPCPSHAELQARVRELEGVVAQLRHRSPSAADVHSPTTLCGAYQRARNVSLLTLPPILQPALEALAGQVLGTRLPRGDGQSALAAIDSFVEGVAAGADVTLTNWAASAGTMAGAFQALISPL